MKKVVFTLAALCVAATAFSQTTFGIKAGPNFSSTTAKSSGDKNTSKMLVGLEGGVYANIPLAPEFYVQPSLMYEGKGGKNSKDFDVKTRLNYLTLPIHFLFKPAMPNGSGSWMIGVGPYLGYGLSGKTSVDADSIQYSFNPFSDDDLGTGDAALKRFDAGASVLLGYEMANGFNIALNAELGLINALNNGDSDNSFRNTSFGLTVGYTLGGY